MYGKDYNYARTRIEGTIVRIRKTNEPVDVQNVSRANGVCSVSLINDIDGDVFLTTLDDLHVEPVPLGYVNTDGNADIGRASCRERVCQYWSISVVAAAEKKK